MIKSIKNEDWKELKMPKGALRYKYAISSQGRIASFTGKIAEGKLNAFFKENTLMAQPFVKDGGKSVAEYLKSVSGSLKVNSFVRVALG